MGQPATPAPLARSVARPHPRSHERGGARLDKRLKKAPPAGLEVLWWQSGQTHMRTNEPLASVIAVEHDGDTVRVSLAADGIPPSPVAPAGLYAPASPAELAYELHRLVAADGMTLVFDAFDWEGRLPHAGQRFILRTWWLPEALNLVRDTTRVWKRRRYTDSDECRFCPLTWKRFTADSHISGAEHEGYQSGDSWISVEGYERYIRADELQLRRA